MHHRLSNVGRVLAIAAVTAMVLAALPGSVATAATNPKACRVFNFEDGTAHRSLQRAVWAADPGDTLTVRGTCVGTTLVRKDLRIDWTRSSSYDSKTGRVFDTGRPRLRSGSWRPALVVDPSVDDFSIRPGLVVKRGVVIDDIEAWKGDAKPVPVAWRGTISTGSAVAASPPLRACYVQNLDSGVDFRRIQNAVAAASPGDRLTLRGKCVGATRFDKSLHITGVRLAISAIRCTRTGCTVVSKADSGPPAIGAVSVDPSVDELTFKRLTLPGGFSVG